MVTAAEIKALVGKRATLRLAREAGASVVTGRIVGALDALDGLVVTVEPDGSPGVRQTYHYHHIVAVTPHT